VFQILVVLYPFIGHLSLTLIYFETWPFHYQFDLRHLLQTLLNIKIIIMFYTVFYSPDFFKNVTRRLPLLEQQLQLLCIPENLHSPRLLVGFILFDHFKVLCVASDYIFGIFKRLLCLCLIAFKVTATKIKKKMCPPT
jgi:hypothetical protein